MLFCRTFPHSLSISWKWELKLYLLNLEILNQIPCRRFQYVQFHSLPKDWLEKPSLILINEEKKPHLKNSKQPCNEINLPNRKLNRVIFCFRHWKPASFFRCSSLRCFTILIFCKIFKIMSHIASWQTTKKIFKPSTPFSSLQRITRMPCQLLDLPKQYLYSLSYIILQGKQ